MIELLVTIRHSRKGEPNFPGTATFVQATSKEATEEEAKVSTLVRQTIISALTAAYPDHPKPILVSLVPAQQPPNSGN